MADKMGAVLVVGGGISGVQTALDLAESGFKVYLVENKPSIGGVRVSQTRRSLRTIVQCVSCHQNLWKLQDIQ